MLSRDETSGMSHRIMTLISKGRISRDVTQVCVGILAIDSIFKDI